MSAKLYDALIIGGGPAGLSMASHLARQAYSTLVFDSGVYRNAPTKYIHGAPSLDYVKPADFRAQSRESLLKHYREVEFCDTKITKVRKTEDGFFEAENSNGKVFRGRKLGLATGVRDMVEKEIEGYSACWGRGIFHCLFCHGYEERGAESVGALATGLVTNQQMIEHITLMAARLAKSVTVYTNGNAELDESVTASFKSPRIRVESRKVARFALVGEGPQVEVTLEDGTTRIEGFVASHPAVEQTAPFAEQLNLELQPSGEIQVSPPFNETSVKGCFAAGDNATVMRNALQAMHMGGFAAVGMASQLQHELLDVDQD
ncbi:thioredoxin reductase [Paramyrothecium foliicola]|nr:thioredoxin reductase [Paramyrothecium foliicola]